MGKKNTNLPVRQVIINDMVNETRSELIRGQLEVNFLREYLEKNKEDKVTTKHFITDEQIRNQIEVYEESNRYYLCKMNFYKDLKKKSIEERNKKAIEKVMSDYVKLPDTVSIDELVECK